MDIRTILIDDAGKISDYYIRNAEHFKPWMPQRTAGYHERHEWEKRIVVCLNEQVNGTTIYFVAVVNNRIVAHCTLSQIIYGVFMACYMGYGVDKNYEGKGITTQVVRRAIHYAFAELRLNRIMANFMPHNNRSAALLKKLGFKKEGLAKNYLKINGRWENHVLTALSSMDELQYSDFDLAGRV